MCGLFSRLFPKPKRTIDPLFGKLTYSRSRNAWLGKEVNALPGEPRSSIELLVSNADDLDWAHQKFDQLRTNWLELREPLMDAMYESALKYEASPANRHNYPDRDRFETIISLDSVRLIDNKNHQETKIERPDYEVDYYTPKCGPFGGTIRASIKDMKPINVEMIPWKNPHPS